MPVVINNITTQHAVQACMHHPTTSYVFIMHVVIMMNVNMLFPMMNLMNAAITVPHVANHFKIINSQVLMLLFYKVYIIYLFYNKKYSELV